MDADDGLIILGAEAASERKRRAATTYGQSLRPPVEGKPRLFVEGGTLPQALLDGLYDGVHVVRFRAQPGSRTALHTHDCDQVLIVTSGRGYIATKDEELPMAAGNVVFISAGEAHVHGSSDGSGIETVMVTRTGHSTDFVT